MFNNQTPNLISDLTITEKMLPEKTEYQYQTISTLKF